MKFVNTWFPRLMTRAEQKLKRKKSFKPRSGEPGAEIIPFPIKKETFMSFSEALIELHSNPEKNAIYRSCFFEGDEDRFGMIKLSEDGVSLVVIDTQGKNQSAGDFLRAEDIRAQDWKLSVKVD